MRSLIRTLVCCLLLGSSTIVQAQIDKTEYFFDTDPGVGNGIAISTANIFTSAMADSTEDTYNISIPSGMQAGWHTVHIRSAKLVAGKYVWSMYQSKNILVQTTTGAQIIAAEYFVDSDPGIGNGVALSITAAADSAEYNGSINTTGLSAGLHKLYIRVKNTSGQWSLSEAQVFTVTSVNLSNIISAEYFVDTDPGVGNGIALAVTSAGDSAEYNSTINTIGLSAGVHRVYVRALSAMGQWSLTELRSFTIASSNLSSIVAAEYFYDTDPGVGNGTAVSFTTTNDSVEYAGGISTTGLSSGQHYLYVRTKDANGRWSLTERKTIQITNSGSSGNSSIASAEYFFDTDPGVGNGFPLTVTNSGDSAFYNGNITISGIGSGLHYVYVRAKGQNGAWSLTDSASINVLCTYYYKDFDGDGFGTTTDSIQTCIQPPGYANNTFDCNDSSAAAYPNAPEICDGIDNDCDGLIDENVQSIYYADADGDGYGNAAVSIVACSVPSGYVNNNTDCNDALNAVNPAATELCDGIDNDCDGLIDEGVKITFYQDVDGDGYGKTSVSVQACSAPIGYVTLNNDCNDTNASINPAATEICDGIDNNCNGTIDEGLLTTYYSDDDGDGFGNPNSSIQACTAPANMVSNNLDCNDFNVNINPAATEICDLIDNDCDGLIDEGFATTTYYLDADGDGFGGTITQNACMQSNGYVTNTLDCNDADANIKPTAIEICDGIDNDCDGLIDAADGNVVYNTYYADADGDGYGNPAATILACTAPNAYVTNNTDCNDACASCFPSAPELCDSLDNDCDGLIDEGVSTLYYADADGDGFGNVNATTNACTQPLGYVTNTLDCDDNNANINPSKQYFKYSAGGAFGTQVINQTIGSAYNTFSFDVTYVDSTNAPAPATYPRAVLDFEGDGNFVGSNDRTVLLVEADITDSTTSDGKRYIGSINALPIGTNYQTSIISNNITCLTKFGPFNYPDVVIYPDLQIFASDITFSNANPSTNAPLTVTAVVHNTSDYAGQNFVVHLRNQYDTLAIYPDITIGTIPPHSSYTVSWNITTPSVPAWCPMQVFVDYTNVIQETNEIDNNAVRPFINGNYNLPGTIVVNTNASPQVSSTVSFPTISISGTAHYSGVAVPLVDSSVAGALITATVIETGAQYTSYTSSNGAINLGIAKPLVPGTYHVKVEVTDFTLTGKDTSSFVVVYIAPPCFADLTSSISITRNTTYTGSSANTIYSGESINGVISISNNGCASSNTSTYALVSQNGGSIILPSINVPALAPGATHTVAFTNMAFTSPGIYNLCATADANNVVSESNETNNSTCTYLNVVNPSLDLSIIGVSGGSFYACSVPTSISFNAYNYGTLAASNVSYKIVVQKNAVLVDSFGGSISFAPNNYAGANIPYIFNGIDTYKVVVTLDTANAFNEANESNNSGTNTTYFVACKPDLYIAGCKVVSIQASNPQYTGTLTLTANVTNAGNTATIGNTEVSFVVGNAAPIVVTYNAAILPGQTVQVSTTVTAPAPATSSLIVTVDPNNAHNEFVESNNTRAENMCIDVFPTGACAIPNFWDYTYLKNQAVLPFIAVGAQHLYAATNLAVNVTVSGPGISGTLNLGNAIVPFIQDNCICPQLVSWPNTFVFPQAGTYVFTFTVDANNAFTECNESNNVYVATVSVIEQPDMRVLSQYINPSLLNPNVGESVSFDITYENIGFQNVNDTMELKLRVNNTDHDSVQVPGLITNDNNTIHFNTSWSSTIPGVHIVRTIIDSDNEIAELSETNNEATRAIIVGELPNLHFKSLNASNPVPSIGNVISFSGKVGNSGDSYADADVRFDYIDNNQDTILIGLSHVNVNANDSAFFSINWTVADAKTLILATIINTNTLEATYDDNDTSIQLGAMTVFTNVVPACNGASNGIAAASAAGGDAPYSYLWSNGVADDTLSAAPGTYTVVVTDAFAQTASKIVTITNSLPPTLNVSALPSLIVVGDTSVLSVTGAATYTWLPNINLSNANSAVVFATPIVSTTYTVTGANAFGCTSTATIAVTVNPILSIDSVIEIHPACAGASTGTMQAQVVGGLPPYTFSINPSLGIQTSAGTFSGLPAGNYTLTVTDSKPISAVATTIVTISAPALFAVTLAPNATTLNAGDVLNISASGSQSISLYYWQGPGGIGSNATVLNTVVNASNSGTYSLTATNAQGCIATSTVNITVNANPQVAIKLFLGGPFNIAAASMADSLRIKSLIPLTQPYGISPYNTNHALVGSGPEMITNSVLTTVGPNAIVDWVFIELRSASNINTVVATRSALLQSDGDVVDLDGTSPVTFTNAVVGNYYIAVKHRNHLSVATANTITCGASTVNIDFTSPSTVLYTKPTPQHNPGYGAAKSVGSYKALYAGNCNIANSSTARLLTYNSTSASDRAALLSTVGATGTLLGYSVFDCDLNGFARFNGTNPDRLVILSNCGNSTSLILYEQLP
jgi:hypothetical protein